MTQGRQTCTSTYVFSARQQEEVRKIYQRYALPRESKPSPSAEEQKLERLHRLDRSVFRLGILAALLHGCLGAAIHGAGIVLSQNTARFVPGMIIAVVGIVLFLFSFRVYSHIARKQRRKVEPEILRLCQELMK